MTAIGFIAHRTLSDCKAGTVVAAFERSAYLDVGGQLVCLASPTIGDGPLSVPCPDLSGLRAGDTYAPSIAFRIVWRPPSPRGCRVDHVARCLRAVAVLAAGQPAAEGLGAYTSGQNPAACANLVVEAARAPLRLLDAWLEGAFGGDDGPAPEALRDLVGLGPGLTPSGDDLLGGVMIAVHALRRPDMAERVHNVVRSGDTGRISRAHLDAAREGAGAAPLHTLLNDVIDGRVGDLARGFAELGRMGHCSGRDAFAGCAIALRAWCRSAYSS